MSRHLHLDLVGGIAGDMTVAALLDAGASFDSLRDMLGSSGLPMVEVSAEKLWKGGLAGTKFDVAAEEQPPSRHWKDIRGLLEDSKLSDPVKARSVSIFERLAVAEAETHGCTPEEVHFHEVGAMDSIVDIVGAAACLDLLEVSSFSCGTVPICEGRVKTEHGVLPLPAPATARLLEGFELMEIPGGLETVTPTGAAILAELCPDGSGPRPTTVQQATGTGLGTAELPDRPNVLRVLVGELRG
ncbi:MAG: LarC family nickel insertion protein [Acidobacteriota bacterium]